MFSQPNAGQMFAQGFQQGQEKRRQNMVRGAMAELSRNPDNVKAWEVLNQADPQAAAQYRQQRLEMARAQLKDHQGQIELGAKIVRQVQPKDQAGWNQALMIAQQAGVDISQVPQQFDPNYAQQLVSLADVLAPRKEDQGRIITPQPGGGAGLYENGQFKWIVQPNDGSQPAGAPAQPLSDEDIMRLKGGQGSGPENFR